MHTHNEEHKDKPKSIFWDPAGIDATPNNVDANVTEHDHFHPHSYDDRILLPDPTIDNGGPRPDADNEDIILDYNNPSLPSFGFASSSKSGCGFVSSFASGTASSNHNGAGSMAPASFLQSKPVLSRPVKKVRAISLCQSQGSSIDIEGQTAGPSSSTSTETGTHPVKFTASAKANASVGPTSNNKYTEHGGSELLHPTPPFDSPARRGIAKASIATKLHTPVAIRLSGYNHEKFSVGDHHHLHLPRSAASVTRPPFEANKPVLDKYAAFQPFIPVEGKNEFDSASNFNNSIFRNSASHFDPTIKSTTTSTFAATTTSAIVTNTKSTATHYDRNLSTAIVSTNTNTISYDQHKSNANFQVEVQGNHLNDFGHSNYHNLVHSIQKNSLRASTASCNHHA
jgi:hypothetical protein